MMSIPAICHSSFTRNGLAMGCFVLKHIQQSYTVNWYLYGTSVIALAYQTTKKLKKQEDAKVGYMYVPRMTVPYLGFEHHLHILNERSTPNKSDKSLLQHTETLIELTHLALL